MCIGRYCVMEFDVKLKGDKRFYLIDLRERVLDWFFIFRDLMGIEEVIV